MFNYSNRRGFSIIGMLFSAAIVAVLCWLAMKIYFKSSPSGKEVKKALAEQGIQVDSYKDMVETTLEKAGDIKKQMEKRSGVIDKIE